MMKIAARILLAILIVAGTAAAQNSSAGVKAGPILCLSGDQESSSIYNPSDLLSLKFGLFYARRISPVVSIQPELHVALKGSGYYSAATRHEESVYFNYLEIPLLVNVRIAGNVLELFAGPYAALLLSHTPVDQEHDWTWEENELKGYDFGAGVGLRFWWRDISLEVQFARGFIDILPDGDRSHSNTTIAFQLGYRLFK